MQFYVQCKRNVLSSVTVSRGNFKMGVDGLYRSITWPFNEWHISISLTPEFEANRSDKTFTFTYFESEYVV